MDEEKWKAVMLVVPVAGVLTLSNTLKKPLTRRERNDLRREEIKEQDIHTHTHTHTHTITHTCTRLTAKSRGGFSGVGALPERVKRCVSALGINLFFFCRKGWMNNCVKKAETGEKPIKILPRICYLRDPNLKSHSNLSSHTSTRTT